MATTGPWAWHCTSNDDGLAGSVGMRRLAQHLWTAAEARCAAGSAKQRLQGQSMQTQAPLVVDPSQRRTPGSGSFGQFRCSEARLSGGGEQERPAGAGASQAIPVVQTGAGAQADGWRRKSGSGQTQS